MTERHLTARSALLPLLLLLLYLLNGCAAIPYDCPRTPSSALYRPEGTAMGKRIQAQAVTHPGASGFFLLPTGIDAFATRARLIDRAEKTLDLQYYLFHDDRTGTMIAIYRIAVQGWSKAEVIREMTQGGFGFHTTWSNLLGWIQKLNIDRIKQQAGIKSPPAKAE